MEYDGSIALSDVDVEIIRAWAETRLEYMIEATLPGSPEALVHFLPPVAAIRTIFLEACRAGVPTPTVLSQLLDALAFALDEGWPDDDEDDLDDNFFELDGVGLIPAA